MELKQKYFEEEQLRVAYNDLVTATKSLEAEMEENMTKAQAQVDKVSKKYNSLVEKYNELQDKFVNVSVTQEKLETDLQQERAEKESLQVATAETIAKFKALNEELTLRVSDLTLENENLNQLYYKATQEALDAKQELEALYQNKYETEMQLNDDITQLTNDLAALRAGSVNVTVVEEMNVKITQLIAEINRLKLLCVNNSVNCTAQYINNTYIENLSTNINVTNTHITNVLQSVDIDLVKNEFVGLLRRYDDVKEAQASLLDRIFALLHCLRVVARTRPPSENEKECDSAVVESTGELPIVSLYDATEEDWQTIRFDGHWAYEGSQVDVFRDIEPLVLCLVPNPMQLVVSPQIAAKNRQTAVLVMGGRCSGRSFTLFGSNDQLGIAYRALQSLFSQLDHRSNQLIKEKQRHSHNASSGSGDMADPIHDTVFEYSVSMSLCEIRNDPASTKEVIYDALRDTELFVSTQEEGSNICDNDSAVSRLMLESCHLSDINDALHTLHRAVGRLVKRQQQNCSDVADFSTNGFAYVVGELSVSVVYHKEEQPVVNRFVFGDLPLDASVVSPSSSNAESDMRKKNLNDKLLTVLRGLSEGEEVFQKNCDESWLTRLLRGALSAGKTAALLSLHPAASQFAVTRANCALLAALMRLHRPVTETDDSVLSGDASADPVAMRAAQRKAKKLLHELREERQRSVQIEAKLLETKTVAEEYIVQFNERNKAISRHYEDEKRINQQLQSDLSLTLRNLRKAVDELSEQRKVNEKLASLCKLLERERLVLSKQNILSNVVDIDEK